MELELQTLPLMSFLTAVPLPPLCTQRTVRRACSTSSIASVNRMVCSKVRLSLGAVGQGETWAMGQKRKWVACDFGEGSITHLFLRVLEFVRGTELLTHFHLLGTTSLRMRTSRMIVASLLPLFILILNDKFCFRGSKRISHVLGWFGCFSLLHLISLF